MRGMLTRSEFRISAAASANTRQPSTMSSALVSSDQSWLMPPMLGTDNMAQGTRAASTCASWPAPLGIRICSPGGVTPGGAFDHTLESVVHRAWHGASTVCNPNAARPWLACATSDSSSALRRAKSARSVSRKWNNISALPGMMAGASGSRVNRPVVYTVRAPASRGKRSSMVDANSASATPASLRIPIGFVPAWFCTQSNTIRKRWLPMITVTMPMRYSLDSRYGPCSIWASG